MSWELAGNAGLIYQAAIVKFFGYVRFYTLWHERHDRLFLWVTHSPNFDSASSIKSSMTATHGFASFLMKLSQTPFKTLKNSHFKTWRCP